MRHSPIFSYVVSGAIAHEYSMGNSREHRPGQIQLMSAGSGVTHSEFNSSKTDPLPLLQIVKENNRRRIWILRRFSVLSSIVRQLALGQSRGGELGGRGQLRRRRSVARIPSAPRSAVEGSGMGTNLNSV